MYTHLGPLSKGERGSGRQCTHTHESEGLWDQCTDTQALYLKVTGEVGDSEETLRTSI